MSPEDRFNKSKEQDNNPQVAVNIRVLTEDGPKKQNASEPPKKADSDE